MLDNPAERLNRFLIDASKISNPQVLGTRNALHSLLGVSQGGDSTELLLRLGEIYQLPAKIDDILNENFDYTDYEGLTWKSGVYSALNSMNMNANIDSLTKNINSNCINELRLISGMLKAKGIRKNLERETISEWINSLSSLIEEIRHSEVSDSLTRTLVKYLTKILLSLETYIITGNAGVIDALESAAGHIFFDSEYAEAVVKDKDGVGKKFRDIVQTISEVVQLANDAAPLLTSVANFLISK